MIKRILATTIIIMCLIGTLPVQAQGAGWIAWLYEAATGTITAVNESGLTTTTFTLPLLAGFDRYPSQVAVGHGGSPIAYVVFNSTTFQGALLVSEQERLIASYALPLTFADSTEFVADESLFNEDNTLLALGYSLDGIGWGIITVDLVTGAVDYSIRHDTPTVAALGLPAEPGLTPVIRQFNGRKVTFNLVKAGTEAAVGVKGFDWDIDSNDLILNPVYASLDSDRLDATGEVVMSLPDNRLSNQSADFSLFQANSLQVYDPRTGGRYPFFNTPAASLQSAHFIQNGELILAETADSNGRFSWTVIQRDGTSVGTLSDSVNIIEARGVQDGFIYLSDTFLSGARTLIYVHTRDGLDAGIPVWTGLAGAEPVMVWAGSPIMAAQVAYTAWAQLAEPVYAPGSTPLVAPAPGQPLLVRPDQVSVAGATPVFNAVLVVGGLAVITTTEGDQLNVRLGAGVNFEIVAKVENGSQVTVLEGPRTGDGFTWWKVRTANGIVGWVVESVDDGGTRLQTLVPQ
jgi:Bacterial SH3 domain